MNPTIKARIESIRRGEVPEGYKRTKAGILPVDWEFNPLSQLAQKSKTKNREKRYTKILTNSANEGIISQTDYFDKQIANNDNIEGYYIVKKGDFVYNPRISVAAPCGPINCYHGEETGVMSPLYTVFSIDVKKIERDYVEQFFSSTFWHRYMKSVANYGVRSDRMNLSDEDFFLLPIPMPARKEQEKIAEILAGQDRVIALKEKLLAEKQKQKKYLMQQLLTGKKRLPGFSGEWKKVFLGELGCCIRGVSYNPAKDMREKEDCETIQLLRANNIDNNEINFNDIYYISKQIVAEEKIIRIGDILISMSSGSKIAVGKSAQVKNIKKLSCVGAFCSIYRSQDNNYIIQFFSSELYRKQLFILLEGSNINNLTSSDIENLTFCIPQDKKEQTAIAEILSTADKEIELLKKDIEQEKLKKKSLMQLLLTGIVGVL